MLAKSNLLCEEMGRQINADESAVVFILVPTKRELFLREEEIQARSHPRYRTQRYRHYSPGIGAVERDVRKITSWVK